MLKRIFCILSVLINIKAFGYLSTDDYQEYLNNLNISYRDLNLTEKELQEIEKLQNGDGIIYGIYDNEKPVTIIFDQIEKVFDIKTTPANYIDFNQLLNDVAEGKIDFTSNILPTEERMKLYDFTYSISKEKVFLFLNRDNYVNFHTNPELLKERQVVVYPHGYEYRELIENSLGKSFEIEYKTTRTALEAKQLIENGEADLVFCSISWYKELSTIDEYLGIDYTNSTDVYFSGTVTKKGTNKELMSAINKLYMDTPAITQLQDKIDKVHEYELLKVINDKHNNILNSDKTYTILVSEHKPYAYKENAEMKGLFVELIDRMFSYYDVDYKLISDSSFEPLNISEVPDIVMPILLTEKNMQAHNLTLPVVTSNMSIISKTENELSYLSDVKDFNIKKIGTIKSNYMMGYIDSVFYNHDRIKYYLNIEELVKAIDDNEVTYGLVSYENFNKYAIENDIININVIEKVKLPIYKISLGTMKTIEGNNLALFLSSIINSMNYDDLKIKYLSDRSNREVVYQNKTNTLIYLVTIIALIFIIIILSLFFITINSNRRAATDYLTKLGNRRTLEANIKNAKQKNGMSMAYIDLDNFKSINDIYGHHYGDYLLVYVANKLKKNSKYSKAFRIGGDEFILIYDQAYIELKDIGSIFDESIIIENTDIKIEGSIGNINLTKYAEFEVEEIINLVDYAMLVAKRKGKNNTVEVNDRLVNDFFTINEVRLSLENNFDEEKIKTYIRSIYDGSRLAIFELVPKYHYKNNIIEYEKMKGYVKNKTILNNINVLFFERLCKFKSELKSLDNDANEALGIYSISVDEMSPLYMKNLTCIVKKYTLNQEEIILKINANKINLNKGLKYLKLLSEVDFKISINLFDLDGSSLVFFEHLNVYMIEIEVSVILNFFKHLHKDDVSKVFDESLLVEFLASVCMKYGINVLLHIKNREKEQVIIDVIKRKIDTKIYYCEDEKLEQLDLYTSDLEI